MTGVLSAIASTVPLEWGTDPSTSKPYVADLATANRVSGDGVVIIVWLSPVDVDHPDSSPTRSLPLQLSDADLSDGFEGVSLGIADETLTARVGNWNAEIHAFIGTNPPTQAQLDAAQEELDRLVIPTSSHADPVAQRGAASAVGVHFRPTTPPANALSRAAAIAAVGGHASPGVKVGAAFGIATDTEYYSQKHGKRHYYVKNRPVWIVTLTGAGTVPDMGGGPRPAGSQRQSEPAERNREMNVMIDGFTGKELEDYSYR